MKILIDTNILLDVALRREPFFADSAGVLDWVELNPKQAAIAWHSVSNLAYLVKQEVRGFLADLLAFVEVAAGDTATVRQALAMPIPDLEDALQASAALEFGAALIVTRNTGDYKKLPIKAMTPADFVAAYGTARG
ncbi:type II toxin-antitoxin system VapC family toxin [Calidithermus roseus]|uniref:PIN domain protein n=1 Tax=Calidithermus roseus TaxID=1644118 RepID=A0A399F0X8_9DEIN|nr:PIN domain-containing protein [Calidithermus roseus]RIH89296.1 PIN domain protein [Calidithermus roseus]